jgi:hypothetical protein
LASLPLVGATSALLLWIADHLGDPRENRLNNVGAREISLQLSSLSNQYEWNLKLMLPEELKQNVTVYGPLFPEPVQIIIAVPMGSSVKLIGKGVRSSTVYEPILSAQQLGQLHASPAQEPFDGDAIKFRLGVEAMRLGLAYEYDPYFSLSIARVDPLPHQLEAVYDYFIKLPRIRFLLADDPGAGKTIMAGLLIKELKIRGLVKRTLIVTPANLSFEAPSVHPEDLHGVHRGAADLSRPVLRQIRVIRCSPIFF